ncbi:hypothetical protein QTP88_004875 [Uroleucon formosanum]
MNSITLPPCVKGVRRLLGNLDLITKYTLMIAAGYLVLTMFQFINKMNYIGSIYAIGAIITSRTSHIHRAVFITGFGCSIDIIHLIFHRSKSSWVLVKIFQFTIHLLVSKIIGVAFEIVTILSLHCYWKYIEEIQKQPEKTWFQHKLGQQRHMLYPSEVQCSVGRRTSSYSIACTSTNVFNLQIT